MGAEELAEQLSHLGGRIWEAIHRDAEITELLFELADAKLALDKVRPEDSRLDSGGEAIMGFDADPATLEQLRSAVPPLEWMKYSL
jgi:hypothetical protein